eukprot:TRINITY_DN9399_c0_g1_i1.p1 TRINITY_DN9399_c0_g1~~TRINITY_DN9399_c0_g1_i1.p1  ORF type:complete len:318 (+),score=43.95 TRINITY_DN9399_c0_g1_i1:26-955(+)
MLRGFLGEQHGAVMDFIEGKKVEGSKEGSYDITADDKGDNEGKDFLCGDYLVTAEGKLMKKVRKRRKKPLEDLEETEPSVDETTECETESTVSIDPAPKPRIVAVPVPKPVPVPKSTPSVVRGLNKNFKNALIVMPPVDMWGPIQSIRSVHDPAFVRWMPHINMIWPFATPVWHDKCAATLRNVLSTVRPFTIYLNNFDAFVKSKGPQTLFLNPTNATNGRLNDLHELQKKMVKCFPDCEGSSDSFCPHLTVGKVAHHMVNKVREGAKWKPTSFEVSEVFIISRPDDVTPFAITQKIPLGTAATEEAGW